MPLVDPQHRGAESGPPMRVLPYEITGRRIDVGAEPLGTGDISPGQISDMLQRGGGASGAGQTFYRGVREGDALSGEGPIYLHRDPSKASEYAGARFDASGRPLIETTGEGGNVARVTANIRNPIEVSQQEIAALGYEPYRIREMMQRGYDAAIAPNGEVLVFDRNGVRPAIGRAPDAPNSVSRTDGGASGAGNAADRFRTNDTPVPVNEGWDTAGSLQQGVDDLAAQRGGWDTMGGRDMGEALIRRHGLDGALEQINRIMADPASRRARQRNGDQGAWEAVQRYIQASVNRRGIGLAPDAPNAGQRGGNGAALAALATLPPGAITLRELLRDHYGTA